MQFSRLAAGRRSGDSLANFTSRWPARKRINPYPVAADKTDPARPASTRGGSNGIVVLYGDATPVKTPPVGRCEKPQALGFAEQGRQKQRGLQRLGLFYRLI
jgi:hypothetical protein